MTTIANEPWLKKPILGPDGEPMVKNKKILVKGSDNRIHKVAWYFAWTKPYGYLENMMESQCCMTYNLQVSRVLEEAMCGIQYGGDPAYMVNAKSIFLAWCQLYGCRPDDVVKHWDEIDNQRTLLGLSANADLPNWARYPQRNGLQFNKKFG